MKIHRIVASLVALGMLSAPYHAHAHNHHDSPDIWEARLHGARPILAPEAAPEVTLQGARFDREARHSAPTLAPQTLTGNLRGTSMPKSTSEGDTCWSWNVSGDAAVRCILNGVELPSALVLAWTGIRSLVVPCVAGSFAAALNLRFRQDVHLLPSLDLRWGTDWWVHVVLPFSLGATVAFYNVAVAIALLAIQLNINVLAHSFYVKRFLSV